jgi:hypothetical protein
MKTFVAALTITGLLATCFAAPSLAANDEATKKDLFTVITLQGLPCGEVVSVISQGENDHVATCRNGNRYHVFLNAAGRVVVEKL